MFADAHSALIENRQFGARIARKECGYSNEVGRNFFFSLHMHAKPSFAHRLQTAKIASSRTSAQNNGPRAQKNGPWV